MGVVWVSFGDRRHGGDETCKLSVGSGMKAMLGWNTGVGCSSLWSKTQQALAASVGQNRKHVGISERAG